MYRKLVLLALANLVHFNPTLQLSDREYASMPKLFHLDDYDHCWRLEDDFLYCNIEFELTPQNISNPPNTWNIIQAANRRKNSYRHDIVKHGLCIPEKCPQAQGDAVEDLDKIKEKLEECYNSKYAPRNLKGRVINLSCENRQSPYSMSFYDRLFKIAMGCYFVFVFLATFYEGCARYYSKEEYDKITSTSTGRFISVFSLRKNWLRLKTVRYDDPHIKALSSIQGIRFYNMILVILTHSMVGNIVGPVQNPIFAEKMYKRFISIFLENNGHSIQIFFMTSSWLLMYQTLSRLDGKEITANYIFKSFLNRLLRLTPMYAIILFYHATLMAHEARGPLWDFIVGEEYNRCRNHGWINLLFINNYVNSFEMCMPQAWYMAVDTQFFIISLLIIWYSWNNTRRLFTLTLSLLVIHVTWLFCTIYKNDWEFSFRPAPEYNLLNTNHFRTYFIWGYVHRDFFRFRVLRNMHWHHTTGYSYAHLPGLPIGLIFGYFYYKYRNQRIFTKKIHVIAYWIISWTCTLGIMLIPGLFIHYCPLYKHVSLYDALFGCIGRTIFVTGTAVQIFGMAQGEGWITKWFFEWKPTYILGRLTYSAYLVHMIFIRMRVGRQRAPILLTDYALFMDAMGDLMATFLGGLILTLFIEMPLSGLQNLLLRNNKEKPPIESNKKIR